MNEWELMMRAVGCVDADLIEEAERYTAHKRSRFRVAVLAAACISIFSVGTVFAVNMLAGNYSKFEYEENIIGIHPVSGEKEYYSIYWKESRAYHYIPIEDLSKEVQELARDNGTGRITKGFSSWEDAEAFYGIILSDNPVWDAFPSTYCKTITDFDSEGPTRIELNGKYVDVNDIRGLELFVTVVQYTERMNVEGHETSMGYVVSTWADYSQEEYYGDNADAIIVHVCDEADPFLKDTDYYVAYLIFDGVEYIFKASSCYEPEAARDLLTELIDGF